MNQASRGSPFSTTLTSRSFLGNCTSTTLAFRFAICCVIAHSMCSSRSGCSPRRLSSALRLASSQGALPSATAILRSQRRWPIRRIADPSVTFRKYDSVQVKSLSRGKGDSATAAAAYRAGLCLDDPSGARHDYRKKGGVLSVDMLAPDGAPAWATDPHQLWAKVEEHETRKNARVARED